jgi:hypothetical protein
MTLTTQDIIQLLPFSEDFKSSLLADFDSLNPDQKFNIEQLVWDAYDELYQIRLEENTQLAFLRVEKEEEEFDADFYKRINEKTDQDMRKQSVQQTTESDLSETREELEKILQQQTS